MRTVLMLLFILIAVGASGQFFVGSERESLVAGTLGALEAEGLIHAGQANPAKTWISQLTSQKLGSRRSRQIYFVQFLLSNGENVDAIAVRTKSPIPEESGLVVYVVSKVLQPDGKAVPLRH
jgi:hypothetical protein